MNEFAVLSAFIEPPCAICAEVAGESEGNAFADQFGLFKRADYVLFESANFVLIPSLGALTPGYSLVVPKKHKLAFVDIPCDHLTELRAFMIEIKTVFASVFGGSVVVFEHGTASDLLRGGSCCDHAHLHVVPVAQHIELRTTLIKRFPNWRSTGSSIPLRSEIAAPYLWLEDSTGSVYVPNVRVESQFLRRALASQMGIQDEWDWLTFPHGANILKTICLWRAAVSSSDSAVAYPAGFAS